jgi:hypothetical protein
VACLIQISLYYLLAAPSPTLFTCLRAARSFSNIYIKSSDFMMYNCIVRKENKTVLYTVVVGLCASSRVCSNVRS